MKIALAQLNTTVGAVTKNADLAIQALADARALGAELIVFPELTIPGYPPEDLVETPAFIRANLVQLERIADHTTGLAAVVGYVDFNADATGKRVRNMAALIVDGKIVFRQAKSLLPTYDVFDEARHFEPAESVAVATLPDGTKLGLSICEDAWNDKDFWPTRLYDIDPLEQLAALGADLIINISASPFNGGKRAVRERMLGSQARKYGVPLVHVNQIGGNTSLVFDGSSMAFDRTGALVARAAAFESDLILYDTEIAGQQTWRDWPADDLDDVLDGLTLGVRDYLRKTGFTDVLIGVSGGIDSALVAAIAARAIGPEHVLGVSMPSEYSSEGSKDDARALAEALGIGYETIAIAPLFDAFKTQLGPLFAGRAENVAEENLQSRIRGNLLMALSNKFGHLVLTTGNKSEMAVGYCTLYGDMCGGLAVIADVPKTVVYQLSERINERAGRFLIPEATLTKAPSAELKPDQVDQDSLPPYDVLDAILEAHIEHHLETDEIAERLHLDRPLVADILRKVDLNEYKRRQAAPGIKVTTKAFGFGRRLPIVQGWR